MRYIDKKIIKDLYKNPKGLFLYTFYQRYKIEPNRIVHFIKKYTENGFIKYEKDKVFLTNKGRNAVVRNLNRFVKTNDNKFLYLPKDFISAKIEVNSFYLPKKKELFREIREL